MSSPSQILQPIDQAIHQDPELYVCPRCDYTTHKKHYINCHFGRMTHCQNKNGIELTPEIKQVVLNQYTRKRKRHDSTFDIHQITHTRDNSQPNDDEINDESQENEFNSDNSEEEEQEEQEEDNTSEAMWNLFRNLKPSEKSEVLKNFIPKQNDANVASITLTKLGDVRYLREHATFPWNIFAHIPNEALIYTFSHSYSHSGSSTPLFEKMGLNTHKRFVCFVKKEDVLRKEYALKQLLMDHSLKLSLTNPLDVHSHKPSKLTKICVLSPFEDNTTCINMNIEDIMAFLQEDQEDFIKSLFQRATENEKCRKMFQNALEMFESIDKFKESCGHDFTFFSSLIANMF